MPLKSRPIGKPKGNGKGLLFHAQNSMEERTASFWNRVEKKESGCWEWCGSITPQGYGAFFWFGKLSNAHRFSWLISNGEIKNGLWVLHKCDNRKCVNPSHLFLGTAKDNAVDASNKGRLTGKNHASKITPDIVRFIRSIWIPYKNSVRKISIEYGWPYKAVESALTKWKGVV